MTSLSGNSQTLADLDVIFWIEAVEKLWHVVLHLCISDTRA